MEQLTFEWDAAKAESNRQKHRVRFEEAETVFNDFGHYTVPDTTHSMVEEREVTIGATEKNRLVTVSHTQRGNAIRIISARRSTSRETDVYNDIQKQRQQAVEAAQREAREAERQAAEAKQADAGTDG